MVPKALQTLAGWLLAVILAASPAFAGPTARGGEVDSYGVRYSRCFAGGSPAEALADVVRDTRRWTCGANSYSIAPETVYARFELAEVGAQPHYFETRRTALAGLRVLAVGADGIAHPARHAPDDIETSRRGGYVRVPLPASASPLRRDRRCSKAARALAERPKPCFAPPLMPPSRPVPPGRAAHVPRASPPPPLPPRPGRCASCRRAASPGCRR